MLYIVGLGNPGKEYERSRHNAGWIVLDEIAERLSLPPFSFNKKTHSNLVRSQAVTLVKPETYMNDSGRAVRAVFEYYENGVALDELVKSLYIVHDDLDLELGTYKIQLGTGPKVHNGLLSLYAHLQSEQFWHVRVGVDMRKGDRSMPGSAYVLQNFTAEEQTTLTDVAQNIATELVQKMAL